MAAEALDARLRVFRTAEAGRYAGELFRESFNVPFPEPRDNLLSIPTPARNWRQYVATYQWPDRVETVGFCNWILWRDVYLGGGMCVQKTFYRRLPREQFAECQRRGGIAQMLLEAAFRELDDGLGWFGYCGDKKALAVDLRAGFRETHRPFVVVKWREDIDPARKIELIDAVAAIGPF